MNPPVRYLPWIVTALAGVYLASVMMPAADPAGSMQLHEAAKIPVVEGGRVKPLDTVARNSLMVISNRQTFEDEAGKKQPAIKWLLDVMSSPPPHGAAMKHRVFRIENDQVLSLLGLEPRSGFRYSLDEIAPKIDQLSQQATRARKLPEGQMDVYDRKLIEVAEHVQLYIKLAQLEAPLLLPPAAPGQEWKAYAAVDEQAKEIARGRLRAEVAKQDLKLEKMTNQQKTDLMERARAEVEKTKAELSPAARAWDDILHANAEGRADEFNKAVAGYPNYLASVPENDLNKAAIETFFNHFEPFYQCALEYAGVFLLACLGFLAFPRVLNRAAFWLVVVTFIVHTGALCLRMYLQGRPPVTNLYSSAVFIGWGGVILGMILEGIYRNGIGNLLAGVMGAVTLVIAHNLAAGGDTLEMMQAVLDTNFWLATHVTCVTYGYAATFVAGILGLIFILLGVLTPALNKGMFQTLGKMIYGIVCFATLLSFTGTVLGGIWADQSWGRFWGWDPKENGALIIVLWNALILHARWGGMVQQRGMAVLAVLGNVVTAWSWFGVNMLGVGLHSYGFMSGAVFWLVAFVLSQLALAGVGMIPLHLWRSVTAQRP